MKERPILFSAPMVRAILDGTKTQTRRIVPFPRTRDAFVVVDHGQGWWPYQSDDGETELCDDGNEHPYACPYGQPGDRLWVRETWMPDPENDGTWAYTQWAGCKHSPLSDIPERFRKPEHCIHRATWTGSDLAWTPSIHMPRWASRILLEVTDVRVERLNDCSESDAISEGLRSTADDCAWHVEHDQHRAVNPVDSYASLWESINGAGSWAANPWVWVVEFKPVQALRMAA